MNRVDRDRWGTPGVILAAVLGALGAGTLAIRASHSADIRKSGRDVRLVEAYDRSGSYRSYLPGALQAGADLVERMDPDRTHLTCYALDTEVTELYDNRPPESESDLCDLLEDRLGKIPAANGTVPSRLFGQIADLCEKEDAPFVIAVYTDGDLDAPDTWGTLKRNADRLARTGKVAFLGIYGVSPENRLRLKSAFSAFSHNQFRLYAPGETDINTLLQRMNEADVPRPETRMP